MKVTFLIILILFGGCARMSISENLLEDGKTWKVFTSDTCHIHSKIRYNKTKKQFSYTLTNDGKKCLNKNIQLAKFRALILCPNKIKRVFGCSQLQSSTRGAYCYVTCE